MSSHNAGSDIGNISNINDIIDDDMWYYLRVEPYPFSKIELNKKFFEDREIIVYETHSGPPLARSGYYSTCHFGKLKGKEVYFYIMDDPGASGYGCCGCINLYYSDSYKIVEENIEKN